MVTSAVSRTPSLITSSAAASVAAAVIASLLLLSVDQTSCLPNHFHQQNISTSGLDSLSALKRLPSSSSSSAAAAAEENLHLVLQHRKMRRRASGSGGSQTTKFPCYSCTYISEEDFTAGNDCNDPFNSAHIPEVMCAGSCHKLKKKLHRGGEMLVRGCMPNCREKVDENGFHHCCKSKLCNSSVSLNSNSHIARITCSIALFLFLVAHLNSFV